MNVIDSSGWLEYFGNGPAADVFDAPIHDLDHLIVPTITLLEVFKRFLQQRNTETAECAVAHMKLGYAVGLDTELALNAAKLGIELKLPLADSIILATARRYNAVLWTQDKDFEGIEGVKYFPRP